MTKCNAARRAAMGSTLVPEEWAWTLRLLLAEMTDDRHAAAVVTAEVCDCADCWRLVAHYAARLAAAGWFHHTDGDAVIELILNGLAYTLDRRDQDTP